MYKNKKGITLIALVITIIVLLILAGIAISMLSGENGIINKAVKARNGMDEAKAIECIKLSMTAARTNTNKTDVSEEDLKSELDKYFDNAEVTQTGSNNYVIEIDGKIYKINNGQVTTGYEKETITDGVIADANEGETIDYKIYGNSVQDGEPSPDNPVEIQSVGDLVTEGEYKDKYKIPVTVSGKNLLKPNTIKNSTYNGVTLLANNDGTYTLNGTATSAFEFKIQGNYTSTEPIIDIKAKKYYTASIAVFSGTASGTFNLVATSTINDTRTWNWLGTNKEPQSSDSDGSLTFIAFAVSQGATFNNYKIGLQIEEVKDETSNNYIYEPYQEPKTTNIYLNEPLRKVGDYADYIDFKNKKVVRKIIKKELRNIQNWHFDWYPAIITFLPENEYGIRWNGIEMMSNYCPEGDKYFSITHEHGYTMGFRQSDTYWGFNDINDLKTWLESNDMKVQYRLKTPIEETIELPEILTHKGTNIITVDTNTKPSKTEITNYKSTK